MYNVYADSRMILVSATAECTEAAMRALIRGCRQATPEAAVARQLRNLLKAGLVQQVESQSLDSRLMRITETGRRTILGPIDPEALWSRSWDGLWRTALFDVPQARAAFRTRLRRKLREMRFGWLQNSVWLSPDPVATLTKRLHDEHISPETLLFFEGRPASGESDQELILGAWDFQKLSMAHAAYLKLLRLRPSSTGGGSKPATWRHWLDTEQRAWREITRIDPFLPEPLWPPNYAGRRIWQARLDALRTAGTALSAVAGR